MSYVPNFNRVFPGPGGLGPRGRFAPSPTGDMHLGNARTALLAWLSVRSQGGTMLLRMEDLDSARAHADSEQHLLEDMAWLGIDWDEGPDRGGACGPYRQTQRTKHYDEAVDRLLLQGQAFLCACSRADVARAASAPHGETDARYPGTCRDLPSATTVEKARAAGREPSVRFRGGSQAGFSGPFLDGLFGSVDPFGVPGVDDFVLRRSDGVAAYQLAVVVDDAAMGITEVIRGADLLSSTPRQLALFACLKLTAPRFAHVPLVLTPGGQRLAKRTRPPSVRSLREAGVAAEKIVGWLAASAGLQKAARPVGAKDLISAFDLTRIPLQPVTLDAARIT